VAASFDTPGNAKGVFKAGDFVYVSDYDMGLQILNVADPTLPTLVGTYNTPSSAWAVAVAGNYAYIADWANGLEIVDISAPTTPTYVGNYNTFGYATHVVVSGNRAYVADGTSGFLILDIADPQNPAVVGSIDPGGDTRRLFIYGNIAFLASSKAGVFAINMYDETMPRVAASFDTPGMAEGIQVLSDGHIVVADRYSMIVLEWPNLGAEDDVVQVPADFVLHQNYPNPFNPATLIRYNLIQPADVRLSIYNVMGQMVETLTAGRQQAGAHSITWQAGDIASGVYFARLETTNQTQSIKMVLLK